MAVVLRRSREGRTNMYRPPTMCQALSVFAHLVFPIAMQVGVIIPTLQMRKLRLGEESSDLRPPSQEVMEQDSAPGLREGCMQVLGGGRK